jgi:hypothetical protein
MMLNFQQWSTQNSFVNEGKTTDKIFNWLSSNFGGSIAKIDGLLSDVLKIENDYMKEWNDIQTEIDSLQIQRSQIKSDPAEAKKLERMIENNNKLLTALARKRKSAVDKINSEVEEVTKGKPRLVSYWNLKKSELEAEVAEDLYNLAKKLTDKSVGEELYDKYKEAALNAKNKDQAFRDSFGKLELADMFKTKSDLTSGSSEGGFSLDKILSMSTSEFTKYAQDMSRVEVKKLINFLTKERNEMYVKLDQDKEKIESSKTSLDKKEKTEKIRDLRETRMPLIRDLRSKITIARRYYA